MKTPQKNLISGPHKELSIYIHIPFCELICPYCDFNKYAKVDNLIPKFIQSLIVEIKVNSKKFKTSKVVSISFGGGTPSYINNKDLNVIYSSIKDNFYLEDKLEFSIETNPVDITESSLNFYQDIGINRVSVGGQSFDDDILSKLGRNHNSEQLIGSLNLLSKSNIKNINLDLIFGVPNQTINQWEKSLKIFLDYSFPHLSTYLLTFEPKTKFFRDLKLKKMQELKDSKIINMFNLTQDILSKENYFQYEISNWSKKGNESKHNLRYWNSENYLGLGPGASSLIEGNRTRNISSLKSYIKASDYADSPNLFFEESYLVTLKDQMLEYLMLKLRLRLHARIGILLRFQRSVVGSR